MCLQYIIKCRYCGYWKHYSWDRCRENRLLLKKGCALGQPSQHPSECEMFPEDDRKRIRRQMTPYECPVKECKSTEIAEKLFTERARVEAARAAALAKARAEWEAKDKAKKAEFAAKYFKKLPVVRFSERRQSFLNLPSSDSATSSTLPAMQNVNTASSRADLNQWADEQAQTLTAENQVDKGKEVAAGSLNSQVFEDSDDDFISESSEEEVTSFAKYIGAIDIQDSGRGRGRGRAIEFHDDGMPIRTVTP
ncbi:hypothetical protein TARUN_7095 [Trichoderma arundinaceum]|uniref:Uncharacterized protein n=1 Tax=Trichoderma arundinaceum TaxID=490622 RepID=A0A395NGK4_TRIAR|nr:hypothetical protein TARUN_7095 [Trichoderma arundinaceum]